jgi:hypothetical protein
MPTGNSRLKAKSAPRWSRHSSAHSIPEANARKSND